MKFKLLFAIALFLSPMFFWGQVKISNNIQPSSLAKSDENALYFVDFWATWCGPCVHASKYLESLQMQFPNNFYIVSLTQESPEVVKKFMAKHNMRLAVAIDYEGDTFLKHNVRSLPYGILFNADGKKLWEGHAADLKNYNVGGYLARNKKTVSVSSFFKLQEYKKEVAVPKEEEEAIKKNFVFNEDKAIEFESSDVQVIDKGDFVEFRGSLQDIISYNLKSYKGQVKIPAELNKYYSMRFRKDTKVFFNKEKYILRALKLRKKDEEHEGDVIVLTVDSPKFWDTNQIDWGVNNPQFLIGDSEIKADNVSLNEIVYKLSGLLETPIIFNEKSNDEDLHDWHIHYKYFEFMSSNLDDYGIKVEKKVEKIPQYVYTAR
ncbi:TlpA disulfide reductase family protein [Postechiella marina]